jgi:hypothetical protein
MELMVATFQFPAIVNIRGTNAEGGSAVGHIGPISNVEAIASRDGGAEGNEAWVRTRTSAPELG